ncbi:MAG: hypothetical protein AB7F86_20240 [Bdellovibrionales bacterium]
MKKATRESILAIGVLALALGFQNCSDVSFDQGQGGSGGAAADDANGRVGQNGDPNDPNNGGQGTGVTPPSNGNTDPNVSGGPGGTTNPINPPPGVTVPPAPPGIFAPPPNPPPGSTLPPGTTPPEYPRVTQGEPPCARLTWCAYTLNLDKAYPYVVDFDWKTNDDPNRAAPYLTHTRGVANVHYVPGSGHVTFLPGETSRIIYVLNINPDPTLAIDIPFIFSACQYGRQSVLCSQTLFRP